MLKERMRQWENDRRKRQEGDQARSKGMAENRGRNGGDLFFLIASFAINSVHDLDDK